MNYFLFVLITTQVLRAQELCYPDVFRHRIDTLFPTSRLFCVWKQNEVPHYVPIEAVQTEQQWLDYSKSHGLDKDDGKIEELTPLLSISDQNDVVPFKIPATIVDGGICSGYQRIEINRNMTIRCKPIQTSTSIQNDCQTNDMLNSQKIFSNIVFTIQGKNHTNMNIPTTNNQQLVAPVWNGTSCVGVLKFATITVTRNGTLLTSVFIETFYDVLHHSADTYEQNYRVQFIEKTPSRGNETAPAVGYSEGQTVYMVKDYVAVPFGIPSIGDCYAYQELNAITFLRSSSSVCTIETTGCEDARRKADAFYKQVYPNELLSAPSDESHPSIVKKFNASWEEKSPSPILCRLPVSSLFEIYTAKQGPTNKYRRIIVAASLQLQLDSITYTTGQKIRMPLAVKFKDISTPPKSVFSSLPYIDVRLPSDFFYPFIRNTCQRTQVQPIIIFVLYLLN